MYFREKLFPLVENQALAISLFDEHLVHLFPGKDTFNWGYAHIVNRHTLEKRCVLPLCTRTMPPDQEKITDYLRSAQYVESTSEREKYAFYAEIEKQTGIAYPIDALVAPNGLAILTFKESDEYFFRTLDLMQNKILTEQRVSTRNSRWLALNDTGTLGVRWRNINDNGQPVRNPLLDIASLMKSISDGILINLSKSFASSDKPDLCLEIVRLDELTVTATMETTSHLGINRTAHVSCYLDNWLVCIHNPQTNEHVLSCYDAQGKKRQEYSIASQYGVQHMEVNNQSGRCKILLLNDRIVIIDLTQGTQKKLNPHMGLTSRDSIINSCLNHDGTLLATIASNNEVVLTSLHTEKPASRLLKTFTSSPAPLTPDGKYTVRMNAGLTFVDDDVMLLTNGQPEIIDDSNNQNGQIQILQDATPVITLDQKPSLQELKGIATQLGLARIADPLVEYYAPMVICEALPSLKKNQPGLSCFGGHPDLVDAALWPMWQGRPMQFIGQFNLMEIANKVPDSDLPKTGLLSLFIAIDAEGMMIYPGDHIEGNEWKVIYQKDMTGLKTISHHSFEYEIDFCAIDFRALYRLPNDDSILIESLQLTREEMAAYQELTRLINGDEESDESDKDLNSNENIALRGHPAAFQGNDLELGCEMARQTGSYFDYPQDTEQLNQFKDNAKELRLLFQLMDSEYIDLGLVEFYYFFFISKEDLKNENFDRIWLNGQC